MKYPAQVLLLVRLQAQAVAVHLAVLRPVLLHQVQSRLQAAVVRQAAVLQVLWTNIYVF